MMVPLSRPLIRLANRPHMPRRTLRMRLTALYGGLFLACGAALLAITYVLVAHATVTPKSERTVVGRAVGARLPHGQHSFPKTLHSGAGYQVLATVARGQRISDLHQLVIWSGITLAIMAIIAAGLGWIVAGRVLRPLRTITTTAREISAENLHRRLALDGPDDELKDLGDTFDALLTRLEGSFDAQRAFVANASHELRTPLALSRAMLQFALADPELTLDSLKATCADVLEAGTEHQQLLEALLMLARSQQAIQHPETFDLAPIIDDVITANRLHATAEIVSIHTVLSPAPVAGDPRLVHRLVSNLVENALRYNHADGEVHVNLDTSARHATLTIANTGPIVPPDQIQRLLQPFRRLATDRAADADGHGLGLSIVAAIATAHDAALDIQPRPDGGLHITIKFPAVSTNHENAPPAHQPARARAPAQR